MNCNYGSEIARLRLFFELRLQNFEKNIGTELKFQFGTPEISIFLWRLGMHYNDILLQEICSGAASMQMQTTG